MKETLASSYSPQTVSQGLKKTKPKRAATKALSLLFHFAIGFGIIVILWNTSSSIDWKQVTAHIRWGLLLMSIPVYLLYQILGALLFILFLKPLCPNLNVNRIIRGYYAVKCFGILTPSVVEDAVLIPMFKKEGVEIKYGLAAFFSYKVLTCIVLITVVLFYFCFFRAAEISILCYLCGALFILSAPLLLFGLGYFGRAIRASIKYVHPSFVPLYDNTVLFFQKVKKGSLLFVLIVIIRQFTAFLHSWLFLLVLGIPVPFLNASAATATGTLLGTFSIFPMNLGTNEAAMVLMISSYTASNQLIILSCLLNRLTSSILSVSSYLMISSTLSDQKGPHFSDNEALK